VALLVIIMITITSSS